MVSFYEGRGCLHLIYGSHYPLITAVGGLSNSENQNEQLLRKTWAKLTVAWATVITAV